MSARARDACALALGVAVALLLAEIALRLLAPQRVWSELLAWSPPMLVASPELPYALKPGYRGRQRHAEFDVSIEINRDGLRGGPRQPGPAAVVIGDSFVFGWGVEHARSLVPTLERLLARGSAGLRFLNAGVPGYEPGSYLVFLRGRALEFSPALVLIGFFIGNDIDPHRHDDHRWAELDADGLPTRIASHHTELRDGRRQRRKLRFRYRYPGLRDSHLFQLGATAVRTLKDLRRVEKRAALIYARDYSEATERRVADLRRLFLGMQRTAREHGFPLAVVLIPAVGQVLPERLGAARAELDSEKPQRIFTRFFAEHGIAHLDLLPVFRAAPSPESLYFERDEHWNEAGHALAARSVAEFLRRERLLPR